KVGPRTMMELKPEDLARIAAREGADAVGANCGKLLEPRDFIVLVEQLRSGAILPVMIQPNAGQPSVEEGKVVYKVTPEAMADKLVEIAKHVKVVGGCCGTNPAHI